MGYYKGRVWAELVCSGWSVELVEILYGLSWVQRGCLSRSGMPSSKFTGDLVSIWTKRRAPEAARAGKVPILVDPDMYEWNTQHRED